MLTKKERKKLNKQKERRVQRSRGQVSGTTERPRLTVKRTLKHCYVQIIDDTTGKTIVAVSDKDMKGTKSEKSLAIGKEIAKKALKKDVKAVIFDRHGYVFHGRVKAVAEGAREAGLHF